VTFIIKAKEQIARIPELATRFRPSKEVWELFGLKWDDELLNAGMRLRQEAMATAKKDAVEPEAGKAAQPDSARVAARSKMGERTPGNNPGRTMMSRDASANVRSALVWVLRDKQPTPVLVKTGVSDGAFVELIDGLKQDDVLVTGVVYKDPKQAANNNAAGPGMRRF
ncbi:MAG TPA: hypothetical protein P5342_04040, partial [Candidatus Cloacimonadota bacterium]|nr:hypothetical protein [Candidatus Cloacimonadota bacterium]